MVLDGYDNMLNNQVALKILYEYENDECEDKFSIISFFREAAITSIISRDDSGIMHV